MARTQQPPARHRRDRAARRAGVRARARGRSRSPCCGRAPTCSRRCSPSRATAVLRRRLHALAEAHEHPEHRDRRRRRRRAVLVGLGGGHRRRWRWAPVVLFVVMFFWTPPHFWALAIRYADDYRAADVPMLPAVVADRARRAPDGRLHGGDGRRARWCSSRWPTSAGSTRSAAVVLGVGFLGATIGLGPPPDAGRADAGVRLQHHLRHGAVRGADARRPRPWLKPPISARHMADR